MLGEFPTLDAAVKASRNIVDEYLLSAYQPGMTAEALFASYKSFGEDPIIVAPTPEETVGFSAGTMPRDAVMRCVCQSKAVTMMARKLRPCCESSASRAGVYRSFPLGSEIRSRSCVMVSGTRRSGRSSDKIASA